jgi:hypothetical protein
MRLYRVFPHLPSAAEGEPGHPGYLHTGQTIGRWDNAHAYALWYLSYTAAGAAGETFGNLGSWADDMFQTPFLPGGRRALAIFDVPDETPILDLDIARELTTRNVRPSQIVTRNPAFTQALALSIFREHDADSNRQWAGLRWWSFHRPTWFNLALWHTPDAPAPLTLVNVEPLTLTHPAITDAAHALTRALP